MRRAVQRKREKESWIQHGVGIRNVKWLMQLLNPQQEHAQPGATTRLSAYLYGGADSEAGWTGMAVKVPHNGWQDTWMLKQCVHVRWAIEQQAKLKSLIKMSFFHFHLSKHGFTMSRPLPVSQRTGSSSAVWTPMIGLCHSCFLVSSKAKYKPLRAFVCVWLFILAFVVVWPATVTIDLRCNFLCPNSGMLTGENR